METPSLHSWIDVLIIVLFITATEKVAMISLTVLAYDPNNYVVNYECLNDEAKNIKHGKISISFSLFPIISLYTDWL